MRGRRDAAIVVPHFGVAPISDRLLVLQLVRMLVVSALLLVPLVVGAPRGDVALVALGYLGFVAAVEITRRVAPERSAALVSWTVLGDGLAITVAVALSGGYRSALLFLVFLDVMAVTLLVSYRVGLKLALWYALLLLLAHAAADAGVVRSTGTVSDQVAVVSAATVLLFASCAAIFSAVNERVLRQSRVQLESLVTLGTELERSIRPVDVTSVLLRHACGRLGFTRAAVLMRDGERWTGVVDDGIVEMEVDAGEWASPLVWESFATTTPVLVRTVDDDLVDELLPSARNVVIAPVAVDGEDLGVAVAEWGGGREAGIPMVTVQALAQAATHTALALRNAELLSEVERLATRDSLTGLANRRLFDESLHREAARSQRRGEALSLVVLDVDHFKQVNDTYGHQTGDGVLRDVAAALAANTKGFDVAARYGGDEFVVLLPGCARDDAVRVAERVRNEIARHLDHTPVTISGGVATMPDNAHDAERLLAAADAALYDAKRMGRDRVAPSHRVGEAASQVARRWSAPLARGA